MKTLILGAGYAGLAVATKLKPTPGMQVTMLERYPYHVFWTRLHEAAAHNTKVTLPLAPLLKGTGVDMQNLTVNAVDLDRKEVTTKEGQTFTYDTLVVGLGSVTNFYRIPGLAENATELKDLTDAEDIFSFVQRAYDASYTGNRDIVVGGAGLTGVELVTELAQRNEILSRERGLVLGEQLKVIGFDDQPWAQGRGLSTLHQPVEAMGYEAAQLLLSRLAGHEGPPRARRFEPRLIVRASTGG